VRPQRIDLYNNATRSYSRSSGNPMQRVRENQDYIESIED
jgi:hypothetical protein